HDERGNVGAGIRIGVENYRRPADNAGAIAKVEGVSRDRVTEIRVEGAAAIESDFQWRITRGGVCRQDSYGRIVKCSRTGNIAGNGVGSGGVAIIRLRLDEGVIHKRIRA